MQSVFLSDSDPATIGAGEGSNLDTFDGSKNIFLPVDGIKKRNLAFVTLEIEIVDHLQTFLLVKKKIL